MAKIPFDPAKQPMRADPAPMVGQDFGTQNLRAQARLGDTVQSISKQAGAIATDYAVKNKNADMKADEMNYRVKKQSVLQNAKDAASKTSDSKEIARIYKEAQGDLDKWVTGNDANGNPNIRWGDMVSGIRGDANQFRVQLDGEKMGRIAQLSHETTVSKANLGRKVAIQNLDEQGVRTANQIMVESGEWTQEMADLQTENDLAQIEKLDVADTYANMNDAVNNGNQAQYEANVDYLVEVNALTAKEGQEQKNNFEQKINYSAASEGIASIKLDYAQNQNTEATLKRLDAYTKEVGQLDMAKTKKSAFKTQAEYFKVELYADQNRKGTKLVNETWSKLEEGKFDYSDYINVRDNLNPILAKNLSNGTEDKLRGKAVTDDDAREAVEIIDRAMYGEDGGEPKISWEQAWQDLSKVTGETKVVASIVLAENYSEQVNAGRNIKAYDAMFKKGIVDSKGDMRDIIHNASFYAPNMKANEIQGMFEDVQKWNKTKKYNGEEMTKDEFIQARFAGEAMRYVEQQTARQQPVKQQEPASISTQEEYDALEDGALYIDTEDGKTYRK